MEDTVRDKSRTVSILQVRTKCLEEENTRLQDRIDSIAQQKYSLDKLLKEQKFGKERENSLLHPISKNDNRQSVIIPTSSGLDKHFTKDLDPQNTFDSLLKYRVQPYESVFSVKNISYFGNSYTGGSLMASMGKSIDLYREKDETGNDTDFDADVFDA